MLLLVGGGGIPNYGDELIIRNWLTWHDSHSTAARDIVVEGYRSRVLQSTFSDSFPRAKWSHNVRNARLAFREKGFWGALGGGLTSGDSETASVKSAYAQAKSALVLHIHGGGYINQKWPSHAFVLGLAAAAHSASGTHAVATGLGLGPLDDPNPDQQRLLDEVVEAFELIEVRDTFSYNYLQRNLTGSRRDKIIQGLDDAFLYPVPPQQSSRRTLHVSLRDDSAGEGMIQRMSPEFVGAFERHVFWACKPADTVAYAKLAKKYPFFESAGVRQLLEEPRLGARDVMITERFHPHLMAARAGASGVFWSGSSYYDTKHGSLVELGSPFTPDEGGEFSVPEHGQASRMALNDAMNVAQKQAVGWRISTLS
ncbi:polysaccharide pyruvyl transferase family protein [Microbacterium sp. NPDC077663]|uniref:polysaccharide pyruvyl transferase family protein n=1 Tax=Microbacterium sp. NPDC077663 TaxID=3364189 RepID=UPI0037C7B603